MNKIVGMALAVTLLVPTVSVAEGVTISQCIASHTHMISVYKDLKGKGFTDEVNELYRFNAFSLAVHLNSWTSKADVAELQESMRLLKTSLYTDRNNDHIRRGVHELSPTIRKSVLYKILDACDLAYKRALHRELGMDYDNPTPENKAYIDSQKFYSIFDSKGNKIGETYIKEE